jgi:hypothetical protein
MGAVIQLHRVRAAIEVLLIPTVDASRVADPTWLRQADVALDALAASHGTLPPSCRSHLATILDEEAHPAERHLALLAAARRLRVRADCGPIPPNKRVANVLRHPTRQAAHHQGRLFDPQ